MREKNLRYGRARPIKEFHGTLGIDEIYERKELPLIKGGPVVIIEGWDRVAECEDSYLFQREKVRPQSTPIPLEDPITPGE